MWLALALEKDTVVIIYSTLWNLIIDGLIRQLLPSARLTEESHEWCQLPCPSHAEAAMFTREKGQGQELRSLLKLFLSLAAASGDLL